MNEFKDSHIHLLFVMKAMNQAQQKQDRVALEDLIKYELKDNLTQWKIKWNNNFFLNQGNLLSFL